MGLSFVIDDVFNRIDGIYLELMFLPFGYESVNPNEKDSNLLDYLYVQAIEKISKKLKKHGKFFKISTSNEQFRATYAQMFARKNYHQIEIDIHPHVMLNKNSQYVTDITERKLAEGVKTLLHAGDPRPGKGLNWVRSNISRLINIAPKHVNFYCHINEIRFPKDYPQVVSDVSWIEKFADENPRLIILRDRISRDDWFNFLSKFDYFIIPNEVSHYKNKTSGVVMDAIFSLKSAERVFVFRDTLIYKIMRDENFCVSRIEDVYSALSTFTPRLPGINVEYINNSKIFRESHASYAGRMLGLA
jgi:hypothetical protein